MSVRVTVITISYNDLQGLERSCRSVASQTYEGIEHIVVDGFSSDGTREFLRTYSASHPHATYVSEPDRGIADAMGKGVRLASGDILMHLNAGDTLYSENVISSVVESWNRERWTWGVGNLIYQESDALYRKRITFFSRSELERRCYLPQPATFFSSEIRSLLTFDTRFNVAMDYDLFYRLAIIEGITPVPINVDVTRFERGGISENYWRAYFENVAVRTKYGRTLGSWMGEARLLIATGLKRVIRQLVLSFFGETTKNHVRGIVGNRGWSIERVASTKSTRA